MFNGKIHYKWPFSIAMLAQEGHFEPYHAISMSPEKTCHGINGISFTLTMKTVAATPTKLEVQVGGASH